ncbi:MAG: efflux RND transporter permease subunit [Candidatus Sumerlaeia bacterium]|nr:efflux RND transporter permease subunit [Candidatus Sumerlaeia bacterium]
MNIAEPFIHRPVMTTLVMAAIFIFGAMAYMVLPVNDLPTVDFPTVQVSASLPGASPETMASSVATPLEREFSSIPGLNSMNSISALGSTQITMEFALERDIDAAAQDVQSAIAKAARRLPPDMPTPPSLRKENPADQPILYLALSSPLVPLSLLDEYGQTVMSQRISMVSGVAQVSVFGSQKYAVRIQLNPKLLAKRRIGIDEVARAVRNANVNLPTGILHGPFRAYTVRSSGQLLNADAYKPVIVAYREGNPLRLGDLGRVFDSVENDKAAAWYNDQRAVVLAVQRQPGTNTVEVVDAIKKLLPQFRAQIPAAVNIDVLYDRSESIRESVNDVKMTLWFTLGLVVAVIFLFLRNVRATAIPSLALPFSIVGTFAVMYVLDYSLDNISLMALTLAVGFVVDDAIVMLENNIRHVEMGKEPYQASLEGSREVGFTILSMTFSLVAVFIPVLFMPGIVGRLFREFAVTIAAAILISGFVSLSLTPMLCSRFLKPQHLVHRGVIYNASEWVFQVVLKTYAATLRFVLRHRFSTLLVLIAVTVATVDLFRRIPKGFIPGQDTGRIVLSTEATQGISFEDMARHQQEVAAVLRSHPAVESLMSSCGPRGTSASGGNTGFGMIKLKDRKERKLLADQIIEQLRPRLAEIPGIQTFLQSPQLISLGGRMSRGLYQFTLQSPDTDELYACAQQFETRLRNLPGIQDVSSDLQIKNPEARVEIDRDKASALGVTVQQIEDTLYYAYGSRQISTIYTPNNQYYVIMELEREYQRDPNALSMLYVRSTSGDLVPLSTLAKVTRGVGPLTINHTGQIPAVTFSFNLAPGTFLSDAVKAIEDLAAATLPASISTRFQGTAQAFQASLKGMGLLLILAILVIYLVLGILYESFIHPVTILTSLPPAGFGALLTLMLFGMDLNLYAFVGVIMLVGLVKKNGIMMIDFAIEAQKKEGKSADQAIYDACLIRFRPIMMTTMAALVGTSLIAIGIGAGAEARRPLGLAVVGGLLFSQTLTLYVTPIFYLYMDRLQQWLARPRRAKAAQISPLREHV